MCVLIEEQLFIMWVFQSEINIDICINNKQRTVTTEI